MPPAAREVDTHYLGFFREPSRAEPENQPAAGIEIDRCGYLRGLDHVALGQQADSRAELDARCRVRRDRQRDEWIDQMPVELRHLAVLGSRIIRRVGRRQAQMFRDEERFETEIFGFLGDRARLPRLIRQKSHHANFHIAPPSPDYRPGPRPSAHPPYHAFTFIL